MENNSKNISPLLLASNPMSRNQHKYRREQIYAQFPILEEYKVEDILSLYPYISKSPEKLYNYQSAKDFLEFLNELSSENQQLLRHFLNDKSKEINVSVVSLTNVNSYNIHDTFIEKDKIDRFGFIDQHIHYNYQRLLEGVFHTMIYPLAYSILKKKNKSTNNLKLLTCVDQLKNSTKFSYLIEPYNNIIRNAIAHDDFVFMEDKIVYKSNNRSIETSPKEIINLFDNLVDICNGMCFALRTFCLSNMDFLNENGFHIPNQFIKQELIHQLETFEWEILNMYESKLPDGRTQLNIYGNDKIIHFSEAIFYAFRTGYMAEKYLPGYDRYFFSSNSKHSIGFFGGFKGEDFRTNRINETTNYKNTADVLSYKAKYKIPKLLRVLRRMYKTLKTDYPLYWRKNFPKKVKVRWTQIHRNIRHSVVNGSVVLSNYDFIPIEEIRSNYKKIIRKARRHARRNSKWYERHKYLRTGFIQISVYDEDLRLRHLKESGLRKELLCTIRVKRLKRIKSPDILGSKIEIRGKYRIAWNKNSRFFDDLES